MLSAKLKAEADNTDLGFDNSRYHAQPHPIIAYYILNLDFSVIRHVCCTPRGVFCYKSAERYK